MSSCSGRYRPSLCQPRACIVTRTTFVSGWAAVSVEPAVWVWKRIIWDFGSTAPMTSRISLAHILRAALNLATSSKKWLCEFQKNDKRGAKSSGSRPAAVAARTYAIPLAIVNATSCAAVAPASRM